MQGEVLLITNVGYSAMDPSRTSPNRHRADSAELASTKAWQASDDIAASAAVLAPDKERDAVAQSDAKPKRTLGLKTFDVLLYPVLNNTGVFVLSVLATYLTSRGGQRNANGELKYGKIGEFFQKRGDWMVDKFKGLGMNDSMADGFKMVTFSFLDGSILVPVVKLLEDRRGKIGRHIDHQLGTKHEDESVYDDEPKQTWGSLLGGRVATLALVLPTAIVLGKAGLNDTLFTKPGHKFGEFIAKKPNIAKYFGDHDIPELSKIGFFEAFYTSLCTVGLYYWSRLIATKSDPKPALEAPISAASAQPNATTQDTTQTALPAPINAMEALSKKAEQTFGIDTHEASAPLQSKSGPMPHVYSSSIEHMKALDQLQTTILH